MEIETRAKHFAKPPMTEQSETRTISTSHLNELCNTISHLRAQLAKEREKRKEAEQSIVGVIKWFRTWIVEGGLDYDNCTAKEVHDEILATHTDSEEG